LCAFQVITYTSDLRGASTDANVYVDIRGAQVGWMDPLDISRVFVHDDDPVQDQTAALSQFAF
jgi:hypothetical protein